MCFPDCVHAADEGAYFSPALVHFHSNPPRAYPVENYTQPCFVCKDTSLAQGNFYLYAAFPANATNEKWRSGPRETLGPGKLALWCLSISLSFKKACWFSIPQYWPTVSVWCMHAPHPLHTHTHTLLNSPHCHANPMFGLNLLVLLLE